jgi:4-hydroxy-2-oxoglutarate aldolase
MGVVSKKRGERMNEIMLKGVLPPMITPFKENGDVDFEVFTANIQKWNGDNLAGYLVNGPNSETALVWQRLSKLQ